MLSLIEVIRTMGYVSLAFLSMMMDWYYICFFGAASCFVNVIIALPMLPESPTFLVVQGRKEEAKEILMRLRGSEIDIEREVKELELLNQREDGRHGWMALLSKDLRKPLFILICLSIILPLSGIPMLTFSTTRLLEVALPSLSGNIITMIAMSGCFFGSVSLVTLVDRIGRRWCLRISLSLMAIAYTVLGTLSYLDNPSFQVELMPSVANASDVVYNTEER